MNSGGTSDLTCANGLDHVSTGGNSDLTIAKGRRLNEHWRHF